MLGDEPITRAERERAVLRASKRFVRARVFSDESRIVLGYEAAFVAAETEIVRLRDAIKATAEETGND